jgi:hypothetical protein
MLDIQRHRIYFTHSPEKHYALSGDIENSVFDKYSINGTRFILLTELYNYTVYGKDIKNNNAGGQFVILVYMKPKQQVTTYRLLKAAITTSSFTMEVDDIEKSEAVFHPDMQPIRPDGYCLDGLGSKYYKFPCPKDMKYSIAVSIEEEKESGEKTVYEFTYFYFLEKKDRWIQRII